MKPRRLIPYQQGAKPPQKPSQTSSKTIAASNTLPPQLENQS